MDAMFTDEDPRRITDGPPATRQQAVMELLARMSAGDAAEQNRFWLTMRLIVQKRAERLTGRH